MACSCRHRVSAPRWGPESPCQKARHPCLLSVSLEVHRRSSGRAAELLPTSSCYGDRHVPGVQVTPGSWSALPKSSRSRGM